MGWRAITKENEELREETHGRPVQSGEEGKLAVIAQEDFGHSVAIDLLHGIIAIDYQGLGLQNGTVELHSPRMILFICEDTNIAAEIQHIKQEFPFARDENGNRILEFGKYVHVRNDILTPLTWRPIWFTRWSYGIPCKVIGAQTTLPELHGGKNLKKMIMLFADGRIGID